MTPVPHGRSTRSPVYVGTMEDAYELTGAQAHPEVRPLGLRGSGGVRALLVDRHDPARLYAGTAARGVLRSTDRGRTWDEVNRGLVYQDIFSLAQHPGAGVLYAGTEPANVFRSSDGGDTWTGSPALRNLPETRDWWFPRPPHIAHVRHIAVCDDDPLDICCAIEDGWLVRSRDGGETWMQVREGVDCDAHTVTFMPDDPAILYVATGNFGYRSTDGGLTFAQACYGMEHGYMAGIAVHPARPHVLLTVAARRSPPSWRTERGGDTAVYRSEDQGRTWERVTRGLPEYLAAGCWSVAGDPDDPDTALFGLFDGSVWATTDGARSFRLLARLDGAVRAITFQSHR
jgi:photosystem II stability/assembly factor-like uncharacterized protein